MNQHLKIILLKYFKKTSKVNIHTHGKRKWRQLYDSRWEGALVHEKSPKKVGFFVQ
eukprot:UN24395